MDRIGYKVFYKTEFELSAAKPDVDVLWDMILSIRQWITKKYKKRGDIVPSELSEWSRWKMGNRFFSQKDGVSFDSCYCKEEDKEYWAGAISEQPSGGEGFAPREWITEIGYKKEEDNVAKISLVTAYLDRPGFIGLCQPHPDFNTPGIVHHILRSRNVICTVAGETLTEKAIRLVPGEFKKFWENVSDETRGVPIVYLSPRKDEDEKESTIISPSTVAKILYMNAIVYYADSLDFSREMTYMCPDPDLGCYSGAIRVYTPFPRMSESGDGRRHRIITANRIREMEDAEEGLTLRLLRRALVQDVHFYDELFSVESCRQLKEKLNSQHRLQKLRENIALAHKENDELSSSADEIITLSQKEKDAMKDAMEEEKLLAEMHSEELENQIGKLNRDLQQVKALADLYRENASKYEVVLQSLDKVRKIGRLPQEAIQIAEYFSIHFSDRIFFTERAKRSMKDCTTKPEILWGAFYVLVDTFYELCLDDECVNLEQEFNSKCSDYAYKRGQGTMTRCDKRLMKQYQDTYCGRTISVEPHLATSANKENDPRFLRIYFCFDQETRMIVVSHCGRHLENYSTRKL